VIEPDQDGTQVPDAVAIDLWAPDQGVFAALRVDRRLSEEAAALVVADDEVTSAHGSAVELGDGSARVETGGVRLEFELRAVTPAAMANAAGLRRAAQLCDVEGTIVRGGESTSLQSRGVQAHSWNDQTEAARRRFVTAGTDDGALLHLVALRPKAATAHGDELVAGQVADPQSENGAMPFEEVRLSTIYRADGLPRTAGAELYRPGDEWPARLSGAAVSGSVLELDGTGIAISFFRWTLMGRPGWGTYEIEPSP
jgi:hypothetical protein